MQFRLPDVAEGITESVLLKWYVIAGQSIQEDDLLCQIETDKAVVDIPSPSAGIVKSLLGEVGEMIKVGAVIAEIESDGQVPMDGESVATDSSPTSTAPEMPARQTTDDRARAAPSTRRHAGEHGVDLAEVVGSGPGGRVLRADVDAKVAGGDTLRRQVTKASSKSAGASPERVPMSRLRILTAESMRRSVQTVPHATSSFRCDGSALVTLRARCHAALQRRISFTALLIKAMVPALKAYPYFNSSIDEECREIIIHPSCNIAFAAQTEQGLIVPVIHGVEDKTLQQIADETERLAELARARQIPLADIQGATITLSNIGSHGGHETTGRPIVNHPQVAIVAVSRIRPEPTVVDGIVCARPTVFLTASYDHRLIDGAYASAFMERYIEVIESPAMYLAYS